MIIGETLLRSTVELSFNDQEYLTELGANVDAADPPASTCLR